MLLEGVFVPVPTPFNRDGALYLRKMEHNVGRYSRTPVAGLTVLGPLSEFASLTDIERWQVLESAAMTAAAEKVLLAGVGCESVRGTLELARIAAENLYDAALVATPRNGLMDIELLAYFRGVADSSPLPVMLWDCLPEHALPLSVLETMAAHSNVLGVVLGEGANAERLGQMQAMSAAARREVEVTMTFTAATQRMIRLGVNDSNETMLIDAGSLERGPAVAVAAQSSAVRTRSKTVGFQIITSTTSGMIEGLNGGATGAMPRLAASAPQACFEVWAAWKDRDPALIAVKQSRVAAVAALFEELGISGSKYGCDLNGYFGGFPRLPLLPLTEPNRKRVEEALREMGS